ncbi:MAG: ComEC/Rec2 family competence protein [Oscillospiraceae bacterium]
MAKRKRKKKQKYSIGLIPLISISIVFAVVIIITLNSSLKISFIPTWSKISDKIYETVETYAFQLSSSGNEETNSPKKPLSKGEVEVHIIDVGQGDSILIKTPTKVVLIDSGENDKGKTVVDYLISQKIQNIDILIATHPHSDHIGGMDYVIDNMNINKILMPKLPDEIVPTTRVYTDVLQSIAKKGLKITNPTPQIQYDLGNGATLKVIAPLAEFKSLNEMSIVTRLDFGESSFLFTGDIEKFSEKSIVESKSDVDVDVLDTAHHGSRGSNTADFLAEVTPKLATISLGKDNDYGHPHKEAVERISKYCNILRTDLNGNIVLKTDGKTIWATMQNGEEISIDATK